MRLSLVPYILFLFLCSLLNFLARPFGQVYAGGSGDRQQHSAQGKLFFRLHISIPAFPLGRPSAH